MTLLLIKASKGSRFPVPSHLPSSDSSFSSVPSAIPLPIIGSLVEEQKCWNQYENKLPHGLYCGGKVSTENPYNQKRGKMRLNWLNWESQKRTTWKISSTRPEKHHPLCMLSRAVSFAISPFIGWPSVALAQSYSIQGKYWELKSRNASDYSRYQYYCNDAPLSLGNLIT